MRPIPCDFEKMEIPTFDAFAAAYPVGIRDRALCEQWWSYHGPEDRKRALFYIGYMQDFCEGTNQGAMTAETWIITAWWKWIPQPIQYRMEAPLTPSPSIISLIDEGAHVRT